MCDAAPLAGTGCAQFGYYAGEHGGFDWNCPGDDTRDVAGCMLSRLLAWGLCIDDAPPPPSPPPPSECPPPPVCPPAPPADTPRACAEVFAHPADATDAEVVACGHARELGKCVATGTCETCASADYVKVTDQCDETGMCAGAPLSGTGCSDTHGYYAGEHDGTVWNCNQTDTQGVTACMLRRLIEWGQRG